MRKSCTWQNLFSDIRYGDYKSNIQEDARSPYIRDYDRIIFSSNFRRLQNKTQVFPLPGPILVHNRLTHTLEVVSVARSLGKITGDKIFKTYQSQWKTNEEEYNKIGFFYREELQHVLAAAALAHDIGNPPFGHAGEEAIRDFFYTNKTFLSNIAEDKKQDFLSYESNAMALHLMMREPFELTYTSLSTIVKYPCTAKNGFSATELSYKKSGFFVIDEQKYKTIAERFNLNDNHMLKRHPFVYLLEAADDICYNVIDLEDAHRLHMINTEILEKLFLDILGSQKNNQNLQLRLSQYQDNNERIGYLRAKVISELIERCANTFMQYEKQILEGTMVNSLLEIQEQNIPSIKQLKNENTNLYTKKPLKYLEVLGFKVLNELLKVLCEIYVANTTNRLSKRDKSIKELLPITQHIEILVDKKLYRNKPIEIDDIPYYKMLIILDYVTGMTDIYAVDLYKRLYGLEESFRFA